MFGVTPELGVGVWSHSGAGVGVGIHSENKCLEYTPEQMFGVIPELE